MKVHRYNIGGPVEGLCKRDALWVTDKKGTITAPVIYFQRPKWVKDDAVWRRLLASIEIKLPQGFEVK
jgi:hypothetical protein